MVTFTDENRPPDAKKSPGRRMASRAETVDQTGNLARREGRELREEPRRGSFRFESIVF